MSRVDVIVPCYNYGHYLRECVESVLTQEGVDVRVLIIDDCSPDNTPQVAAELMSQDSRIEYRRHEKNIGHIATYNEGLEWASGDYLLLLSADDLLISGALGRAAGLMDAHPEVVMTYGGAIFTDDPARDEYRGPVVSTSKILPGDEYIEKACRGAQNLIPTPTAVLRTSVQHRIGGYRKELPHAGDMEMWLRCAAHGAIGVLDAYQAYYRTHPASMSNEYRGLGDLRQRALAFETLFKHYGESFPNNKRKKQIVSEGISRDAFDGAYKAFEAGNRLLFKEFLKLGMLANSSVSYRASIWCLRVKFLIGQRYWSYLRSPYRRLFRRNGPGANHSLVRATTSVP
jgi:glycosyltransferase involved in cell wall biosynthesis